MNIKNRPSTEELKEELISIKRKRNYFKTLRNTIYILLIVAAISILVATMFFPVLQVTGTSMEPTLKPGQIILTVRNTDFKRGDLVAFYYNNKIILKRVIGLPGEYVNIDKEGVVTIDGKAIKEPYLKERSLGDGDIEFPYQVPEGRIFVLGDHRKTSIDSRYESIGAIANDLILGKVVFRVWPIKNLGKI
ncbi:MAG: signal peptidase I [Miniphocaeibacter sp.]|uniref:signal peptidase I n=1 Tax=Miniphocaeibacter sp. TaxID=3100973 RepID=UPI0017FD7F24|nr:signal peptidase I [Gallicola sp.]